MTSQFLSHFKKQLEATAPCVPFLDGMTREEQIVEFTKTHSVVGGIKSSEEVERLLDQKIAEHNNHIGDIKLYMLVFYPDEFRVEVISFWLSEAEQIERRYSFMEMATEIMPRSKKL